MLIKQISAALQLENELEDCVCSQIVFGDFADMGASRTYSEITVSVEQMSLLLSRQDSTSHEALTSTASLNGHNAKCTQRQMVSMIKADFMM